MKQILFLSIFVAFSTASAQQYINPTRIGQPGDIILQNTNVYYTPMAPPDSTDVRDSLSNLGSLLVDPNGVGTGWFYGPRTHDTNLQAYKPCDTCTPYGTYAIWQRLFTARDKEDQSLPDRHSDIIVGDSVTDSISHGGVIISKNEDVDFRASGTIKMEAGFHVMPGAFFHAYIEPRWPSTPVFSDEFTDSTLDGSKWTVANGPDAGYQGKGWIRCSSDSNVRDTADPDAHDGHALDVILREVPNTCMCFDNSWPLGTCENSIDTNVKNYYIWSSAIIHSCPWPWTDNGDTTPVYQHAPYGKYEFREKIPHMKHHTNNWGFSDEYDLDETWGGDMSQLHPGVGTSCTYGPFTGSFGRKSLTDTTWVFRSSGANWCWSNNPTDIIINGFSVNILLSLSSSDTFAYIPSWYHEKFPVSFVSSGTPFTFYYQRDSHDSADKLPWSVSYDTVSHKWDIFSAGYHDSSGHLLHFSKDYQPTTITLTYDHFHHQKTLNCHWDHTINSPDQGLIHLDSALASTDLHIDTEAYYYTVSENNYGPAPPYAFDGEDTSGGYEYHTFGMELTPNQAIFLFDSSVVFREPDRMVPRSSKFYDAVSQIRRSPVNIFPAENDIDNNNGKDSLGTDSSIYWIDTVTHDTLYNSPSYGERHYFEVHPHNPGLWDVSIGGKTYHAAHTLIDYVKVWDVPADVKITPFPN